MTTCYFWTVTDGSGEPYWRPIASIAGPLGVTDDAYLTAAGYSDEMLSTFAWPLVGLPVTKTCGAWGAWPVSPTNVQGNQSSWRCWAGAGLGGFRVYEVTEATLRLSLRRRITKIPGVGPGTTQMSVYFESGPMLSMVENQEAGYRRVIIGSVDDDGTNVRRARTARGINRCDVESLDVLFASSGDANDVTNLFEVSDWFRDELGWLT